ncbi:hypothetical protein BC835DRAFT_1277638 [Cytidiella melzeri]|nr:hypothetical protein BC835DRAFT_1277638 [Cytidiella melzeri]
MPTCVICLKALCNPAALPCGHVFCYDCIVTTVRNVQPFTQQHFCAACRAPYTIANIDSSLIPTHLRPHLTPAIRRLCLDFTAPVSAAPDVSSASECDRLRSENASLRACCEIWRKRAAVHAAASLGLVGLARLTRDEVFKTKKEKMDIETRYNALKRAHSSDPIVYR